MDEEVIDEKEIEKKIEEKYKEKKNTEKNNSSEDNTTSEENIVDDYSNESESEIENDTSNEKKEINTEVIVSNKNKKTLIIIIVLLLIIAIACGIICATKDIKKKENKNEETSNENSNENKPKELPKPELAGGERGKLGIDKNINESNIDEYLGREDAVYRDMRMLDDPANYEAIGGDRYLSGYIKGFEVVPLPYILPVTDLPAAVGKTYQGKTLFSISKDGNYVANYEESRKILEDLFPKDKVIFLMCGGGGYAGMTRAALISLGWDENKIYNIGGYWYYEGKNNVEVKKVVNGKTTYDFDSVPYHEIDFDKLHALKTEEEKPKDTAIALTSKYYNKDLVTEIDKLNYDDIEEWFNNETEKLDPDVLCPKKEENNDDNEDVDNECKAYDDAYNKLSDEYDKKVEVITEKKAKLVESLLNTNETFIITFDEGHRCGTIPESDPRGYMFDIAEKYNIYVYDIGMDVYKKTKLYKTVKYAPGVIIYSNGKILAYTDAESDEHTKLYESEKDFKEWLSKYIKLSKK